MSLRNYLSFFLIVFVILSAGRLTIVASRIKNNIKMKKFFLGALLCTVAVVSDVSAQTFMKSVFYGEKSRDSAVNPCNGCIA